MGIPEVRRLDWLLPSWLEDVSAYSQSSNEDLTSVGWSVLINTIVGSTFLVWFIIYRRHNLTIYCPKIPLYPGKTPAPLKTDTYFGWIFELMEMDDQVLIDKGSFDILFFVRFYRLCFKILAFTALYCWAVLIPVNG
jgi:hypothetical protein